MIKLAKQKMSYICTFLSNKTKTIFVKWKLTVYDNICLYFILLSLMENELIKYDLIFSSIPEKNVYCGCIEYTVI